MANKVHAVGVIFENDRGQILVLRRTLGNPEGMTWGLVGGKVSDGWDEAQTAVSKTQSEIGYTIDPASLVPLKTYHWDRSDLDLIFAVFKASTQGTLTPKLDADASTEYMWANPQDLYDRKDLMIGLYPILEDSYGCQPKEMTSRAGSER